MKAKSKQGPHRFPLNLLHYGNSYYIDRIADLEAALKKRPRQLQIDLIGAGEIPADWALLVRSVLLERSPKTRVITNARSSLQNSSVLVWLLGDLRLIRADASVFFRRAEVPGDENAGKAREERAWRCSPDETETDPDEADYAKVLKLINEFLPVKELTGRMIEVPILRQFGLVESEKLDDCLTTLFGGQKEHDADSATESKKKPIRARSRVSASREARQ